MDEPDRDLFDRVARDRHELAFSLQWLSDWCLAGLPSHDLPDGDPLLSSALDFPPSDDRARPSGAIPDDSRTTGIDPTLAVNTEAAVNERTAAYEPTGYEPTTVYGSTGYEPSAAYEPWAEERATSEPAAAFERTAGGERWAEGVTPDEPTAEDATADEPAYCDPGRLSMPGGLEPRLPQVPVAPEADAMLEELTPSETDDASQFDDPALAGPTTTTRASPTPPVSGEPETRPHTEPEPGPPEGMSVVLTWPHTAGHDEHDSEPAEDFRAHADEPPASPPTQNPRRRRSGKRILDEWQPSNLVIHLVAVALTIVGISAGANLLFRSQGVLIRGGHPGNAGPPAPAQVSTVTPPVIGRAPSIATFPVDPSTSTSLAVAPTTIPAVPRSRQAVTSTTLPAATTNRCATTTSRPSAASTTPAPRRQK
ncbi:MAG: hypothetical protein M3083_04550 [Actinomycetota bacterium]|nr:hypothetical protein [Actinomycetota bacterium]